MNALGLDLLEIKKWLQRGDIKAIAKDLGYDPTYVSCVLSGKYINHDIINKAIDKAIERKIKVTNQFGRLIQI